MMEKSLTTIEICCSEKKEVCVCLLAVWETPVFHFFFVRQTGKHFGIYILGECFTSAAKKRRSLLFRTQFSTYFASSDAKKWKEIQKRENAPSHRTKSGFLGRGKVIVYEWVIWQKTVEEREIPGRLDKTHQRTLGKKIEEDFAQV